LAREGWGGRGEAGPSTRSPEELRLGLRGRGRGEARAASLAPESVLEGKPLDVGGEGAADGAAEGKEGAEGVEGAEGAEGVEVFRV